MQLKACGANTSIKWCQKRQGHFQRKNNKYWLFAPIEK